MNLLKFIDDFMNIYVGTLTFMLFMRRKPNGNWKKDRVRLWKQIKEGIKWHSQN